MFSGTAGNCSQNNTRIISAPQNSGFSGSGRSRRRGKLFLLLHGIACSYCGEICLDPEDPVQRQEHVQVGKFIQNYSCYYKHSVRSA